MHEEPGTNPTEPPDEPPPLGSWPRMYALVLGNLAFWIVLFYFFTKAFE